MANFDKHSNFNLRMRNSEVLNTKRSITQASNESNWWSFEESFAGCHGNIITL